MKKYSKIMLSILVVFTIVLSSCSKRIKPSSTITSESRNHTGFNGIDVSSAFEVYITTGAQESVLVETNANLHQYIITEVVNGDLRIKIKDNINLRSGAVLKVYVSTPNITSLDVSGASKLEFLNGLTTTSLSMDVSGASTIHGHIVATSSCNMSVSGASNINLSGSCDNSNVELSGASTLRDYDFVVGDINIDLSGASTAYLTVNGGMNVSASGASSLNYKGTGTIDHIDLSGSSTINKY